MTKKLEELFNLPNDFVNQDSEPHPSPQNLIQAQQHLTEATDIIDRIDQALPQVRDLDMADNELDELSDMAKEKFEDLMNLGMNVEARFSGQILQTAGVLLGHAITAKQAKIDKKLKVIDLQLKKMRLDQTSAKSDKDMVNTVDGQALVLDRNALLQQILASKSEKKPQ